MLVILKQNYDELCREAARILAGAVQNKPELVLGLPTGATPLGMYRELIRLHREKGIDFSRVITFNLDEYIGLPPDHEQSYHFYMQQNFFRHVNLSPGNTHIPDGAMREDYDSYCNDYEGLIRKAGGIDLQVLGIGKTGHIGFNEPASSLASRTRLKTLTAETLAENQKFFSAGETVPECVITMGIGTIMEARRILLLASGTGKAPAVARAVEGPVSASVSASALQFHQDVTILLDEDAASQLLHRDYYRRVEEMTARWTPRRLG